MRGMHEDKELLKLKKVEKQRAVQVNREHGLKVREQELKRYEKQVKERLQKVDEEKEERARKVKEE